MDAENMNRVETVATETYKMGLVKKEHLEDLVEYVVNMTDSMDPVDKDYIEDILEKIQKADLGIVPNKAEETEPTEFSSITPPSAIDKETQNIKEGQNTQEINKSLMGQPKELRPKLEKKYGERKEEKFVSWSNKENTLNRLLNLVENVKQDNIRIMNRNYLTVSEDIVVLSMIMVGEPDLTLGIAPLGIDTE